MSPTISPTFTITTTASISPTSTDTPTSTHTATATQTATETATQTVTPYCGYVFGNDQDNNNANWAEGYIIARRFTAPSDFSINTARIKLTQSSSYIFGIYSDVSGKPGMRLAVSEVTAGVAGWNTIQFTMTAFAATKYWILINADTNNCIDLNNSSDSPADSAYLTATWADGLKSDMTAEFWIFDAFDYNPNAAVYGCEL